MPTRYRCLSKLAPRLLGVLAAFATESALAQWTIQTVQGSNSGWQADLALDYASQLHGAYYSIANVRYTDLAQPGVTLGPFYTNSGGIDVAVDRRNDVQFLHYTYPTGLILTSRSKSGSWTDSTIVSSNHLSQAASEAFDRLNRPYLGYIDWQAQALKYARWTGSSWDIQTVATGPEFKYVNSIGSIFLDRQDQLHALWFDFGSRSLMYAYKSGPSTWTSSVIGGNYAAAQSLVFDRQNVPHVAWSNENNQVYYATFNGTTWTSELVGTGRSAPDLVLDAQDQPHIAYAIRPTSTSDGVRHTFHTTAGWVTDSIDSWTSTIDGSEIAALQVDRRGGVHVMYSDDSEVMHYAYKAGAAGQVNRSITPTFDAQANASSSAGPYSLVDGQVLIGQLHSASLENRGVMEFGLAQVPDDATIYSAQLQLQITGYASGGPTGPYSAIDLYGYAGNGLAELADAIQTSQIVGGSASLTSGGIVTIDLDPEYVQSLLTGGDYLGLLAIGALDDYQSSFASSEYAAQNGTVSAPTLLLTYSPEPGSIVLFASALIAQIILSRPRGRAMRHSAC